jgi:hypothetical protein
VHDNNNHSFGYIFSFLSHLFHQIFICARFHFIVFWPCVFWFSRTRHPRLVTQYFGRDCLFCYYRHQELRLDSEWHSIFDCHLHSKQRREFIVAASLESFFLDEDSSIASFTALLAHIRSTPRLVDTFARFMYQIQNSRFKMFRHLSTTGPRARLAELLLRVDMI